MKVFGLLILVFIVISSGTACGTEKCFNQIRDFLLEEFNEIPPNKTQERFAKGNKPWFKRHFGDDNYDIKYQFFKSKKDTIIEDYGRMFKYIKLGLFTFPDTLMCNNYVIAIFCGMDISLKGAKKLAKADSLSMATKTTPGIIIQYANSIIRVHARSEDYIDYRDDRDDYPNSNSWKRKAKIILNEIKPENYKRIYISKSGYIELIDKDYWSDE